MHFAQGRTECTQSNPTNPSHKSQCKKTRQSSQFWVTFLCFSYLEPKCCCAMETIPEKSEEEKKEEGNNNETELTMPSHHSALGHSPVEPKETGTNPAGLPDGKDLQIRDGSKGKSEFLTTNIISSWHYYWETGGKADKRHWDLCSFQTYIPIVMQSLL